jgi:hypothetical protein
MEGENKIRIAITGKCLPRKEEAVVVKPTSRQQPRTVRTGLSFDLPTKSQQRSEKALGFDRWPLAHAATGIEMFMAKGRLSLC